MTYKSTSQQDFLTVETGKGFHVKPITMKIRENNLKLIVERVVNFKLFEINGYPLKEHFKVQGWLHFFDILNGLTYPYLVKDLWLRVEIYDEVVA